MKKKTRTKARKRRKILKQKPTVNCFNKNLS
jgi:hypothetical protein